MERAAAAHGRAPPPLHCQQPEPQGGVRPTLLDPSSGERPAAIAGSLRTLLAGAAARDRMCVIRSSTWSSCLSTTLALALKCSIITFRSARWVPGIWIDHSRP